ncbi:MAG: metallophosphoesterase, partial [Planctomycetes bacterium]|nr:metallophosphoesterase [Planctomycetota bacterium]
PGELPETNRYTITHEEKAIINVGSVGQPRDRDPRAGYVVVYEKGDPVPRSEEDQDIPGRLSPDDEDYWATVEYVRLEYDVDRAIKKIMTVDELDDFLGTRLLEGR